MPRRRYVWSHPLHTLYVLRDATLRVTIQPVRKPEKHKPRKRAVFEWQLTVAGVTSTHRSFADAEKAVPASAFARQVTPNVEVA